MSAKSSRGFTSRVWSRLVRSKKRESTTILPPPASPSHQHVCLPDHHAGTLGVPGHNSNTHLVAASNSHCPSVSNVSTHSTVPLPPSPQHLTCPSEGLAYQNYSSTHLAPSPTILQFPQGNASTLQGPNHMFSGAHNFVMINPEFNDYGNATNNFMKEFLDVTIIGAEFDSSDRDPPPRCHPGTRLAIIQRCLDFIVQCEDEGKLRWIVGPAGVGKSAVMQMVTEKVPDGIVFTSIFLSVNGRRDGTKTILTIAYQLAVKCGPYRRYIQEQIGLDPSLLRKSLSVHFNKFIVEPFMLEPFFEPSRRFLMLIDGLDECDNPLTQQELLRLISNFCITYPASPIAWIVASRPEPHITSFFDRDEVKLAYTKEEMEIDSDEASEEVQRYLRDELKKIQLEYPTLKRKREWPLEHEFTKIASAAGGLFAYAATVIRYIGDPYYGDPSAQLCRVLETINGGASGHGSGRESPMPQLDALYKRILSNIPDNAMINTRKLLLIYSSHGWPTIRFREQCNSLGLTEDAAYGAIRHLHAVMRVPDPHEADDYPLAYYHKSFEDFLLDFKRSGFSENIEEEVERLQIEISLRILNEVAHNSDGVDSDGGVQCYNFGYAKGRRSNISLSWPGDEHFKVTDDQLRLNMHRSTMVDISYNFSSDRNFYGSIAIFHILTTHFTELNGTFPYYNLQEGAFVKFRDELTKLGKLKQVQLRALDYAAICGHIYLWFTSPIGIDLRPSEHWNQSCKHRKERVDDLQHRQGWLTSFRRSYREDAEMTEELHAEIHSDNVNEEDKDIPRVDAVVRQEPHRNCFKFSTPEGCDYCVRRLARYIVNNPDQLATVFTDSTRMCYVELTFVDPDDGVSEWKYRFLHSGCPTGIDV